MQCYTDARRTSAAALRQPSNRVSAAAHALHAAVVCPRSAGRLCRPAGGRAARDIPPAGRASPGWPAGGAPSQPPSCGQPVSVWWCAYVGAGWTVVPGLGRVLCCAALGWAGLGWAGQGSRMAAGGATHVDCLIARRKLPNAGPAHSRPSSKCWRPGQPLICTQMPPPRCAACTPGDSNWLPSPTAQVCGTSAVLGCCGFWLVINSAGRADQRLGCAAHLRFVAGADTPPCWEVSHTLWRTAQPHSVSVCSRHHCARRTAKGGAGGLLLPAAGHTRGGCGGRGDRRCSDQLVGCS